MTVLIDLMGIGLVMPVTPRLVESFVGGGPSNASVTFGLLVTSYALASLLGAPLLGAISDAIGRRPVLLLAVAGLGINYVAAALAPNLLVLFAARIFAGLCGASYTTAAAYIADVTPPERRAAAFGLIGAAAGSGFILGPAIGGLLGDLGPRVPFVVAAILAAANFLYGLFVLPESLPRTLRRTFTWRAANPFRALLRLARFKALPGLALLYFFVEIGGVYPQAIWVLFTDYRFGWSSYQVGVSLALVGLFFGAAQAGLTRIIVPRLGERSAVLLGLGGYILGCVLFAFATESWQLYVIVPIYALGGLAAPSVQAVISARVPADEQGELQGALASTIGIAAVLAPICATCVFGLCTGPTAPVDAPGAPFLVEALLLVGGLLLALQTMPRRAAVRRVPITASATPA
ncbi:TCR/Tet family MFS transporter [Roseiterribacter gracilis]|uniref:Tetracycline resistance MFS efflux pump n=1 Tax=Roseiterribacter gracilis TaxID=2812848 RepID=A0A8S8X7R2_9PROT|nr:tetracycline resistance MFS efflux pump [Rhodospirillales bacterium TMPK1]